MVSPKFLVISLVAISTVGTLFYGLKDSGKQCGGAKAATKEYQCPKYYECVLESEKAGATGVCRFKPGGILPTLFKYKSQETPIVEPFIDPVVTDFEQTQNAKRISFSHNKFGIELFKTLALANYVGAAKEEENIALSPVGVGAPLSLIATTAQSTSKDQMNSTLQISGLSYYQILDFSKYLRDRLTINTSNVFYSSSGSIWANKDLSFNDLFVQNSQKYFNVQIQSIEGDSTAIFNTWVSGTSGGKVQNIVPEGYSKGKGFTTLAVTYFSGDWSYSFPKSATVQSEFTNSNGSVATAAMMSRVGLNAYKYYEDGLVQAVKLDYGKGEDFSMFLLLPRENINSLLSSFSTENWQKWLNASFYENKHGTLILPKFTVEYGGALAEPLKVLGMRAPFAAPEGDFSTLGSIKEGSALLVMDNVLHKTLIEVKEDGVLSLVPVPEEDPITKKRIVDKKAIELFDMTFNRPFVFVVVNQKTNAIVVLGLVRSF